MRCVCPDIEHLCAIGRLVLVDALWIWWIIVLPDTASLIAKKQEEGQPALLLEGARVDCQPRIVHHAYLGSAEKVAVLVKECTAPLPLEATSLEIGMPSALWPAAQRTGVFGFAPVSPVTRD